MSFPESERIVFAQNPLVEVICQLTFPPVLAIASEAPAAFQEIVRNDYPLYERGEGFGDLPADVSRFLSQLPIPMPQDAVTHRFLAEDRTAVISLTREFVAVTTTTYTRWEDFRREVDRAKRAVEDIYHPSFYSRVGLRYRDLVDKVPLGLGDAEWRDLVNEPLLGLLGAEEEIRRSVEASRGEALLQLDEPPGSQVRLLFGLVDGVEHQQYIVDADWFTSERSNPDDVYAILDDFNRQAGHLFRWAIKPRLRDALGSRHD